jgi:polysaccharide biosynthesis/export protein
MTIGLRLGTIGAVSVVACLWAAPAMSQTPATMPKAGTPTVTLSDGYVLGPGDVVEIAVLGRDEYRPRVQVQVDGTIQLPYIDSIQASNRTVLQLRGDVRSKLIAGGYYTDPAVSVIVVTYASRYVVVLGQVGTPGIVPVDRAYRLSELLARVGGPKETGADMLVLRRASGEEIKLPFERVAIGGGDDDPIVNPGDKVYVGPAETFYVSGQVRSGGKLTLAAGMTVQMALAQAGGLTDRGSDKRIKITRKGQVISGTLATPVLPGDVITVGERFF